MSDPRENETTASESGASADHRAPDSAEALADAAMEADHGQLRRFTLQRDIKRRLDRYLRARLPGLSRSRLQKLINDGQVTVNGQIPKPSTIVGKGDVIDVQVPPPRIKQVPPEPIPVEGLYEDEHIICVNKQAGLVVHPARSNLSGTLVNALAWHFKDVHPNGLEALSSVGVDEFRPGIVHRLDKDTTGAMVVAKNDHAHGRLSRQFEKRKVQKYYLALVHGEMEPPGDAIDQPIGKHPAVTEAYAVRNDATGREAVTLYRVREVFDGYSLVELELKTGRTHQIRVHLTWLGHPIVSDIIYGGEPIGEPEIAEPPSPAGGQPYLTYARQKSEGVKIWERIREREDLLLRRPALHAAVLQFAHPVSDETVTVTAPLPTDMQGIVHRLRRDRPKSGPLAAEGAAVDLHKALG
jgi:23S rRNA pseudouridine1911/1915/1917 synthase